VADRGSVVLGVEDDLNDRLLLQHAFRRGAPQLDLRLVKDAFHAEDYLLGRGAFTDRAANPLPWMILLDLKLPRRSGLGFLAWLNAQGIAAEIPVFALSSSQESIDIRRAYALGVRSYLVKSVDLAALVKIAEGIGAYAALLRQAAPLLSPGR
jgi:CheY-like chemotaxis protein